MLGFSSCPLIPQPEIDLRDGQRNETRPSTFRLIRRGGAVLVGALLMPWPAFYNGYPLLYPDSMSYLEDGPLVARALFLHRFSADYGGRSFIYCLGILPLHWNVTPWPIVGLNSLLTAYVLWLVVRSILPRKTMTQYVLLVASLSLLTSVGWYVSLIMPDIYGPVLYLSIFLLVLAPETLSRAERLSLVLMAWWSAARSICPRVAQAERVAPGAMAARSRSMSKTGLSGPRRMGLMA